MFVCSILFWTEWFATLELHRELCCLLFFSIDFSYCTESCHLQTFSDDSAVVGCISGGEETEYRTAVDNFVTWCEQNHLQLSVTKTKGMVVKLRRTMALMTLVSIHWVSVDIVEDE